MTSKIFNDVLVVGMHFRERDGIPAKSIVANLVPPATLQLEREPENAYDAFAIKVLYNDQHIGYIEAAVACYIAPWMDSGIEYTCQVEELVEKKRNLHPSCQIAPKEAHEPA
jgi:hypothetical protein